MAVLFIVVVALALGFAVVNALYHNAWGTFHDFDDDPYPGSSGFYLQKFRPGAVAKSR